jgi:hypothetical protein
MTYREMALDSLPDFFRDQQICESHLTDQNH